ncbi:uncharacterized protein GVI51_L07139 [Nakaseomyces glabratus]|uniref:U1-type domain-containing protein n=1 Tax=Candida glabrata (strain ATCC 2001 / BCRC 20586 / JCM 3761 / NBRC 0622 / NRRL Y-65 / CBS 138) TaxID=284593 RepID=Q6FL01_CANGA|nr:uncharacterized protein CAGL0L07260g [Nakaseomyces glabratus]KAH7580876.1 Zinc-finger of C2H2 type [Nakaseomyces glabratus]KAH7582846.1 Zinc-finger of C2H2 type [Nakaseomyces glabratus]KAH7595575.1 Zinc-finger of C2H2 type [Nakaseomyces glabratus]KAH7602007.1 Zinc-finger of C2H2 type [Nakaseomyces glabratus]KAI8382702.1 Zinc-finger of C2H2 type [Nakaseomyces glabratus]|eukprot:XP_449093.1 uncharacterized protein CAGL0L07260g [[Candida] glabrata]
MSNFGRRTWDRDEYDTVPELSHLQSLKDTLSDVQLEQLKKKYTNYDMLLKRSMSGLNKRVLATNVSSFKKGQQYGFYCELCNITLKDSLQYVDHLNHKSHELKFEALFEEPLITETRDNDDIPIEEFNLLYKEKIRSFVKANRVVAIPNEDDTSRRKKKRNNKTNISNNDNNDDDTIKKVMGFSNFE